MWAMALPPSTCVAVVVAELGGRRLDHCIYMYAYTTASRSLTLSLVRNDLDYTRAPRASGSIRSR